MAPIGILAALPWKVDLERFHNCCTRKDLTTLPHGKSRCGGQRDYSRNKSQRRLRINYERWSTIVTWDASTHIEFQTEKAAQTHPPCHLFRVLIESAIISYIE